MNLKNWSFIDLFAGIGGFHLALKSFKASCVFSSEWDKHAKQTYFNNFGVMPFGDITKILEKDIPKHDILCAGFPCQAFSISGKQGGFQDTRGTLFFDVARIINYHQPKIVLLENVKNFSRHDGGKTLEVVMKTMNSLGYDTNFKVIRSSYFGVPQARDRIYIVGFKKSLGELHFKFPLKNSTKPKVVKDILDKDVSDQFFIKRNDISYYKDEHDIKDQFSPHQIGKINKGGQGERIYSIHSSGITLSANGGGAAAKTGAYLINKKVRRLTPNECLKMQGFPRSFKLPESNNIAYKQLGNSVSVPVIKSIIRNILKSINASKRFSGKEL